MDDAQRVQILGGAGYAFGALGVLAPGLLTKSFGMRDDSDELKSTVRAMSFRNIALAQVLSMVADDERLLKRFMGIGTAMFAADTVFAIISAIGGKVSARTGLMLATTTGALAVVAAGGALD